MYREAILVQPSTTSPVPAFDIQAGAAYLAGYKPLAPPHESLFYRH